MEIADQRVGILATGAHPDDVQLMCGGLLARLAAMGIPVGILDLTRGEMGTLGTPEIRAQEAEASRALIGAQRWQLNLGDTRLSSLANWKRDRAIDQIASVIRIARPQTLILPYPWMARHPDHSAAAVLGREAWFMAGVKNRKSIEGEVFRPTYILYAPVTDTIRDGIIGPTIACDISEYFEMKMDGIRCFASQFTGDMSALAEVSPQWKKNLDLKTTQCQKYGELIGVRYAEPFVVDPEIGIPLSESNILMTGLDQFKVVTRQPLLV